jgi:hypothetical protein
MRRSAPPSLSLRNNSLCRCSRLIGRRRNKRRERRRRDRHSLSIRPTRRRPHRRKQRIRRARPRSPTPPRLRELTIYCRPLPQMTSPQQVRLAPFSPPPRLKQKRICSPLRPRFPDRSHCLDQDLTTQVGSGQRIECRHLRRRDPALR